MLFKGRYAGALAIVVLFAISGCSDTSNNNPPVAAEPAGVLPENANEWVCEKTPKPPSEQEMASWCADNAPHGIALPDDLRTPPLLADLTAKNLYDKRMESFLRAKTYEDELNWSADKRWRLTGPYVGDIGSGGSYGTHPAVKIYYSPEIVDWMCGDRSTDIPDGAMIVKSMHSINAGLGIQLEDDACMDITEDPEPGSWTVMIKNNAATTDGWYWGYYSATSSADAGNPPLLGMAGVTSEVALRALEKSTQRDPDFYPTGGFDTPIPDMVYPNASYGAYCINCHGSAAKEATFSSLDNILTDGLMYRQFSSAPDRDTTDKLGLDFFVGRHNGPTDLLTYDGDDDSPFPTPLSVPSDSFLRFYSQLAPVSYSEAIALSMPGETYDHALAGSELNPHGPTKFVTSDQCMGCHDAASMLAGTPNMVVIDKSGEEAKALNLSPYAEWRASPMGLAGRDPIFFAQLESETNHLPQLATCIEQTCLRCHGVMGSRQLAIDTPGQGADNCESLYALPPPEGVPFGKEFTRDVVQQWPHSQPNSEQNYAALARDGISCTVCHSVSPDSLGQENSFTGNFVTGSDSELYGPYADDTIVTAPMKNAIGITPKFGAQLVSADMCGSCHNILLPIFANDGTKLGDSYEQSTHLEWTNSVYGREGAESRGCNSCHMATHYKGTKLHTKIANIESNNFPPTTERLPDEAITLTERSEFARHQLHGLNVFLNQMFQQFPLVLGIRQIDGVAEGDLVPPLVTGMNSMVNMARTETADIDITSVDTLPNNKVRARVEVTNKAGHYLPSGVGFRRVFLELLIRDKANNLMWASGRTNELGAILDGITENVLDTEQPRAFPGSLPQPHYQQVTSGDQVQIYQEVYADSAGNITTSFLRRVSNLKDNRIKPLGYDPVVFTASPSAYIRELAILPGKESTDPYYTDPALTGADTIEYIATLTPAQMADLGSVEVNLYNQSIPPSYLQERFADASVGPMEMDDTQRLYYLTSHLNTDAVKTEHGPKVIESWKLQLASDRQTIGQ
jgi:hypothetical protein